MGRKFVITLIPGIDLRDKHCHLICDKDLNKRNFQQN